MITPERARKALELAKQDPSAFTDDELDELIEIAAPKAQTQGDFGESGSILGTGPTGLDAIAPKLPTPPDEEVAKLMSQPSAQKAMKLTPRETVDRPGETEEMARERRKADDEMYRQTHFGDEQPEARQIASKRKDLFAPPELIPEKPPETMMGGINPMEMFSQALGRAKESIHMTEYYLEPPVSQFRRDMAPYLPDVATRGIDSTEYKEYSDQRWKEIYDQAKAEGRPIVRVAYKKAETGADVVKKALVKDIAGPAMGLASGVNRAFGGLPGRALPGDLGENMKLLGETHPISEVAGEVIGSASRISPGGLATTAISKALPAAGARTLMGAAGRGALAGSGAGVAATTALAAADDRLPTGGELFMGGGLGAIPGGLQGAHKKALIRRTPELGIAESSGIAETDALTGMRRTPKGRAVQEASEEALGQSGREQDFVAGRMEKPLTQGARELSSMTKQEIGVPQQQYFDMTRDVRKPQTPLLKEAMKLHAGGAYETGSDLPVHRAQNQKLQRIIADASHAEIVPAPSGQPTVKASYAAAFDITPEEAMQQGIDVDRHMAAYMRDGQAAPGEYLIRVTPKELNPEQTESVIRLLHEQIGEGKNVGALKSLHRASREVRDQFPAMGPIDRNASTTIDLGAGENLELKGWSAWQHQAMEKTQKAQRTIKLGGFSDGKTPERLIDPKGQHAATTGYRQPGHPDADQALRDLAELGGAPPGMLEAVAGEGAMKQLGGAIPTSYRSALQGARLRMDPLLQFFGPAFGAVAPGSADRLTGKQKLPDALDPETLKRMRNYKE